MIVDAHHHLWRIDQGYTWLDAPGLEPIRRTFSPAELRAELIAHGVDRTVLVESGRCDVDEARLLFGYVSEIPEIAGVVAWADPCSPELGEILRGYRALPGGERLAGIREQIQGIDDPGYFERDDLRRGLGTIGANGLAFDLVIRSDPIRSRRRRGWRGNCRGCGSFSTIWASRRSETVGSSRGRPVSRCWPRVRT